MIVMKYLLLQTMEYNTSREQLTMPEYGRHIQEMVNYIRTIEDPEKRQKNAQSIIELMGVLNPHLKNVEDFRHKLWDHLFNIADFDLEVKSPYPIPTREKLSKKPEPLPYPTKGTKHMHLGKNLMNVLDKALAEKDEEKRKGFAQSIAYYMKLAYTNWHKEPAYDDQIREELTLLSKGELDFSNASFKVRFSANQGGSKKHNHKKNNKGGNNNRNNNSGGGGAPSHFKNKNKNNRNK